MISGKREECSMQKKFCFPIGMGDTQLIWKKIEERGRPHDQLEEQYSGKVHKTRNKEERPKIRPMQ